MRRKNEMTDSQVDTGYLGTWASHGARRWIGSISTSNPARVSTKPKEGGEGEEEAEHDEGKVKCTC
jgi:hypothetical protein